MRISRHRLLVVDPLAAHSGCGPRRVAHARVSTDSGNSLAHLPGAGRIRRIPACPVATRRHRGAIGTRPIAGCHRAGAVSRPPAGQSRRGGAHVGGDRLLVPPFGVVDREAERILNVCKLYLSSPVACVSGVTGSDLKKRIDAIMANRAARNPEARRRILPIAAGAVALIGPIAIGALGALPSRGQSQAETNIPAFEAASVKRHPDTNGRRDGTRTIEPGELPAWTSAWASRS